MGLEESALYCFVSINVRHFLGMKCAISLKAKHELNFSYKMSEYLALEAPSVCGIVSLIHPGSSKGEHIIPDFDF